MVPKYTRKFRLLSIRSGANTDTSLCIHHSDTFLLLKQSYRRKLTCTKHLVLSEYDRNIKLPREVTTNNCLQFSESVTPLWWSIFWTHFLLCSVKFTFAAYNESHFTCILNKKRNQWSKKTFHMNKYSYTFIIIPKITNMVKWNMLGVRRQNQPIFFFPWLSPNVHCLEYNTLKLA